ncbi:MAG: imidazole glycerol phosphate synthase subunit HisH [Bacteroidetes bacterium]|nr:MAG: imidazole glycerol phosphate synthase subunit HisH [Bacteroidota bacterium]
MKIAIIKYNAGNIKSVSNALGRLGIDHAITDDPDEIKAADKVIFPGVGEASTTMAYLKNKKLDILIRELKQPVLGICLGMQLMCNHSEEGDTPCLGIFDLPVTKFLVDLKIPHMGWNSLHETKAPLLDSTMDGEYVYFVHSYYVPVAKETAAVTHYGIPFSAALQKNNFFATQFHPEKSGGVGERILKRFINTEVRV